MENPSGLNILTSDSALINATNFLNEFAKLTEDEIMEQMDLVSLIKDTQNLFELYSSNDARFLDITKRVRGDEIFRFTSDNSQLIFDDSELEGWLHSCDDAVISVIIGRLAENIYRSYADRLNEKAILESIEQSKEPEATRFLMEKAKDNFLFFLENILKLRFKNVIQISINMVKDRAKSKKVITCWN